MKIRKKLLIVLLALLLLGLYGSVASLFGSFIGYKIAKNPQIITHLMKSSENNKEAKLSDREIVKIIVDENPKLKDGDLNEFEIAVILREWVFKNVPVVFYNENLRIENLLNVSSANQIPSAEKLYIFRNGKAGAWCSATAITLADIYRLFGFESYVIDSGDIIHEFPQATHSITLVRIKSDEQRIYSVQDAYLNYTLTTKEGKPIGYFDMLNYLKNRQVDLITVKYGKEKLKPRLVASGLEEELIPEKVFENGNKIVLEEFNLPDYEINGREFLMKEGYPNNLLYLQLFPYNAWGADENNAQNILRRARVLTGTWCYIDGQCFGLSD
ncbi:MAG: hypothetical protein Q8P25_04970 [Candidatus Curtissbacteria bacterium]|nr:hypothetical protein [Candidatus Curtissbacteria bacterium]